MNSRHVADLHISSSRAKHEKTPTLRFFATAFVACRLEGPRRCSAAALQLRRSHPPQQCSSCPSVMCIRVFVPSSVRSICSKDFCPESETVLSQRRLALCHRARWDAGHSLASGSLSAGLADDESSTWQLLAASPTSTAHLHSCYHHRHIHRDNRHHSFTQHHEIRTPAGAVLREQAWVTGIFSLCKGHFGLRQRHSAKPIKASETSRHSKKDLQHMPFL